MELVAHFVEFILLKNMVTRLYVQIVGYLTVVTQKLQTMNYDQKKAIADDYLSSIAGGIGWDDLADINSLHDCETKEDVIAYCIDRLAEEGFPMDLFDDFIESY